MKHSGIWHKKGFLLCVVCTCMMIGCAAVVPMYKGIDTVNAVCRDAKTGEILSHLAPCASHPFGTNSIGQDMFLRVWTAVAISLCIGIVAAVAQTLIGTTIGVVWGLCRRMEMFFLQLYLILDNIPSTILMILISYIRRPGMATIIIALTLTGWLQTARFIRNQTVLLVDREYQLASICLGTPFYAILFRNYMPYLSSVICLRISYAIPMAIGAEVFLSYIGLGLPTELPSLGNLLTTGQEVMFAPSLRYQLLLPVGFVVLLSILFQYIGGYISDATDPRLRREVR